MLAWSGIGPELFKTTKCTVSVEAYVVSAAYLVEVIPSSWSAMVSELGVASDILPLLERHGSARGETPHIAYAGNAEAMSALCAVIGETSGEKVTGACADMAIASRLPFENWFLSVSPGDGRFRLGGGQAGLAGYLTHTKDASE